MIDKPGSYITRNGRRMIVWRMLMGGAWEGIPTDLLPGEEPWATTYKHSGERIPVVCGHVNDLDIVSKA